MTNLFVGCCIGFAAAKLADLLLSRLSPVRIIVHPQHYGELIPLAKSDERRDSILLWAKLNVIHPETRVGSWSIQGDDECLILRKR